MPQVGFLAVLGRRQSGPPFPGSSEWEGELRVADVGNSLDEISQWLQEPRLCCYEGDGRALATWDDEGIATCQIVRVPDLDEVEGGLPLM